MASRDKLSKLAGAARRALEEMLQILEGDTEDGAGDRERYLRHRREFIMAGQMAGKLLTMQRYFAREDLH